MAANHQSQDGKAVIAYEKVIISVNNNLSYSWFKTEILSGLNGTNVKFLGPSANDSECRIVAVRLATTTESVVLG